MLNPKLMTRMAFAFVVVSCISLVSSSKEVITYADSDCLEKVGFLIEETVSIYILI
jgi:hypothetical protein